ncbi:MAG: MFS transporter [Saprospiraceae bacterium]|nr:MFS transporter [Saprospiraceae bacterium]
MQKNEPSKPFTPYQKLIVAVITFLQFTIVLDFMVLSPLSAILLDELNITTTQFGLAVSAYAFSAGISGVLVAGFADKFDRKRLLLFFYCGFIIGTFLCGFAPNYEFLLMARIVTGLFGGVIGAVSFAIITDLFPLEKRGEVMGYVQMAFAASQVLGIPLGLYMANKWGWHSPFLLIASIGALVFILIAVQMRPVNAHITLSNNTSALLHLWRTLSKRPYFNAFMATTLLATGGYMLMPFGAAFSVNNLGIRLEDLPMVYMITGIFTLVSGPLIGRLSDRTGKYRVFFWGSILTMVMILIYTNLGITPLWLVIVLSCLVYIGVTSRIISSSALMTAVPSADDRGAFMSVSSSIQQLSGGIAAAAAGMIIFQEESGYIQHYPTLGIVVAITMTLTILLMLLVNRYVQTRERKEEAPKVVTP